MWCKKADLLYHSEALRLFPLLKINVIQADHMETVHSQRHFCQRWLSAKGALPDPLRFRLRQWQQARTWARLICEAESFWHLDQRELRRLGALELSQLLEEVPVSKRGRVDRWLFKYSAATRFTRAQSN